MAFESMIQRARQRLVTGTQTEDGDNKDTPDLFTRHMGGEFRKNQPFFTGYHQVIFRLPNKLFDDDGTSSGELAAKWLTSTCESFTPHTITPNFTDVMGQGQIGATFLTGKTVGREFTLAFREYQNLPITGVIDTWLSVFDEHIGASPLAGDEFIPMNYKGSCIVYQLKPTGAKDRNLSIDDIEELYIYNGVFPKSHPRDTVGASDQTANDTVQLSITFSFDGAPLSLKDGNEVAITAMGMLNGLADVNYTQSYNAYRNAFMQQDG